MRLVFFGTPQFAVPTLKKLLLDPNFEVLGVVTQPDKRRGRGSQLIPSPVKQIAQGRGLPVWQPQRLKQDSLILEQIRSLQADCFIVVAYGQILPQAVLDMPRLGCINVHGSLLPKYRGAAPIQWCLCHGESPTGITTMQMDAGMDTGPMLLKAEVPIDLLSSTPDLAEVLAHRGADLLIATLNKLARQELQPMPQNPEQVTYAPLIQKSDYNLDWSRGAIALHNQVRGFAPSCVARFRGQRLKILATAPLTPEYASLLPSEMVALAAAAPKAEASGQAPGRVVQIAKGLGPIIETGAGWLLLREVQLPGKRPQTGSNFVNGNHVDIGEQLGNGDY